MSTSNARTSTASEPASVTIIGHSSLFYWWPVWAVGFLMAFVTYLAGGRMAIVPPGTVAEKAMQLQGVEGSRDVLVLPAGQELAVDESTGTPAQPGPRVARGNGPGAVFFTVLLLVILITNVRISGVWSLVLILLVLFVSVALALAGFWDGIFKLLGSADVHVTGSAYLILAVPIFVIWLAIFLFYDRLNYASFSRGQFTIHHAFGSGATSYEVQGLSLEKKRDDLFRHWLLGMGSGDLVVRTGGANPHTYELPNVLFVGSKLAVSQRMLQERQVVKT